MTVTRFRPSMIIGFLITAAMIGTALFFQYVMYLDPCPLCITQRVIVIGLGVVFLIAAILNPSSWGRRIVGLLLALISFTGILVAGRHTWLQHLPPEEVPECGPGLQFWIDNLPAQEVIQKLFHGSGECAEVVFTFIGLSIPEWSLIAFILFFLFSLKLLFSRNVNR